MWGSHYEWTLSSVGVIPGEHTAEHVISLLMLVTAHGSVLRILPFFPLCRSRLVSPKARDAGPKL